MELYAHMHTQYTHYKFAEKQRLSSKSTTTFKAGCSHLGRSLASFDVGYLFMYVTLDIHFITYNVTIYMYVQV